MTSSKKTLRIVLGVLQIFVGIGAIPAGLSMLLDPTGASLGMSLDALAGSPFPSYFVPGLFLLVVNGVGSLVGAALTFTRHRRASLVAIGLGAFLVAWLIVQVLALGPPIHWLQAMYFVLGVAELVLGWRLGPGREAAS